MKDSQVIGVGLLGFGTFFFILGTILLLDRALLVMSNIMLLMAITILLTPKGFYTFVIQKDKIQGSIAFFLGIILVFLKLPLPGIICEVVGAYWLFGGFLPLLASLLMKLPFLSNILPFLSHFKSEESLPL
ncbi:Vesicle transport protein GOT1A [Tritrichomonas musculus]|uniref:Vesicle transport protein GOT1A n=1 Tax=Tritrichomonas musculus TaxID=1915356 RepID=A0ABR2HIA2_9EUKA